MKVALSVVLVFTAFLVAAFPDFLLGHSEIESPPEQAEVELADAISQGLVICQAMAGEHLTYVVLHLHNPGSKTLRLVVLPGTQFVPSEEGYQTMGALDRVVVTLLPGEERDVVVPVACFDMELLQPDPGMALTVSLPTRGDELARLLGSPTFRAAPFRVRQFAVWTLLARPQSVEEYAGLGLGEDFVYNLIKELEELGYPAETLAYLLLVPDLVYLIPEEEVLPLMEAFTKAGIPVDTVDDIYRLLSTGGPTHGELVLVRQIFEEARIPVGDYPTLLEVG